MKSMRRIVGYPLSAIFFALGVLYAVSVVVAFFFMNKQIDATGFIAIVFWTCLFFVVGFLFLFFSKRMKSEKKGIKHHPKPVVIKREEKQADVIVQKCQQPKKAETLKIAKDNESLKETTKETEALNVAKVRYSFEEITNEEFERLVKELKYKDKK
ncbi:MAG: hypothetical protein NT038_03120 [Euryarchaeota archaeon]|nr:hypothetical protein [Euryarchaeota archaeon]